MGIIVHMSNSNTVKQRDARSDGDANGGGYEQVGEDSATDRMGSMNKLGRGRAYAHAQAKNLSGSRNHPFRLFGSEHLVLETTYGVIDYCNLRCRNVIIPLMQCCSIVILIMVS